MLSLIKEVVSPTFMRSLSSFLEKKRGGNMRKRIYMLKLHLNAISVILCMSLQLC